MFNYPEPADQYTDESVSDQFSIHNFITEWKYFIGPLLPNGNFYTVD